MSLPCAYANLRAKAIPEPIGKSRASVDVDTCTVDSSAERLRVEVVLRDDGIGVVRGMIVDVLHGVLQ